MAAPTPIRQEQIDPFERHFTPKELAELWRLDESTVRRIFQDEPGVLKIGNAGRRNKRDYVNAAHSGIDGCPLLSGQDSLMVESQSMLTIWRRHTAQCPHREKGRDYLKCNCPIWADGYVNGKRTLRQSLKTRDMARARKRAAHLEDPQREFQQWTITEAITAFDAHWISEGLKHSTLRKYRNSLAQLREFCDSRAVLDMSEITVDTLDAFRAGRGLSLIASAKELELLRQFFKFCLVRRWTRENPAAQINGPKNIQPNEIEPYTPAEVESMISACELFGRTDYELHQPDGEEALWHSAFC